MLVLSYETMMKLLISAFPVPGYKTARTNFRALQHEGSCRDEAFTGSVPVSPERYPLLPATSMIVSGDLNTADCILFVMLGKGTLLIVSLMKSLQYSIRSPGDCLG